MRTTKLQRVIEKYEKQGFVLAEYTSGIASYNTRSNSGRIIKRCEQAHPDRHYIIVIGAKNRYSSQGTKNAIMYRQIVGNPVEEGATHEH